MSADASRMWASQIMAAEMLRERAPPAAQPLLDSARLSFSLRLALQHLRKADVRALIHAVGFALQQSLAAQLLDELLDTPARSRRGRDRRRQKPGACFMDVDPTIRADDRLSPYTQKLIKRLQTVDKSPPLFESGRAARPKNPT